MGKFVLAGGNLRCSVVVCSHNPNLQRLGLVMEGLKRQTLDVAHWELIIVDNRSAMPLRDRLDLSWHPRGRVVEEAKLGLVSARIKGIRESIGDLLVFVDDDNVLDDHYLEVALGIQQRHPFLSAFGGSCVGIYDSPVPLRVRPHVRLLAVREVDRDSWSNLPQAHDCMPRGAGLCVLRTVALHYADQVEGDPIRLSLDRVGDSLASSGDADLALAGLDLGYGMGTFRELSLNHLIPSARLREDYLLRLAGDLGCSTVLRQKVLGHWSGPQPSFLWRLKLIIKQSVCRLPRDFVSLGFRISTAYSAGQLRAHQSLARLVKTTP